MDRTHTETSQLIRCTYKIDTSDVCYPMQLFGDDDDNDDDDDYNNDNKFDADDEDKDDDDDEEKADISCSSIHNAWARAGYVFPHAAKQRIKFQRKIKNICLRHLTCGSINRLLP